MKKKLLSMMLATALVTTSFVACGGSSDTAATTGDDTATADAATEEEAPVELIGTSDDPNTLTVTAWDANFNIPALEAAAAAYQKENPDFKLEIQTVSGSSDVEQAVTLAGSSNDFSQLPDIVLFQDHYIQNYVANYPDAWQDLEGADIDWSDFGAEKLSYSTIDGKHYGAPVDNGTCVFAYRIDILEQAGYTIDDVTGITWDRWLEIARDVKEKTGYALLSMDHSGDDLPYMMLQAEGQSQWKDGKPNLVGNETFKKIIEVIVQGANDGTILLANGWTEYTDNTIKGDQVAGVFNGNWIIPTIESNEAASGKWEITTIPTLSGKEGYASNGGSSLYITGNCEKVELAQAFLAYTFGGGEGAMDTYDNALRNGGVITTCVSASKSDVYNEGVAFFNDQPIYTTVVEYGTHVPTIEQNDYHYTLRTSVGNLITNVQNGADIDAEIENAQSEVEFAMEE
ncbi:MAG: extracellular solute-binding protein [Lachnospiraceae bacterium]|jgi:lactose/L-arabinose transport system substrate-binding protein|nr:extracellular solute-binding protein [Lachnospiraceae bacterium]